VIRFLADENCNNEVLRGIRRRVAEAQITRIQDTELSGKPDTLILEWAVREGYIVLSHDVNTMRGYFYERVNADLPVPGLFLIHATKPVGAVIDSLELILLASSEDEWEGIIQYLPF
jgi:Domain of unknown function (DUF5615)